MPFWSKSTELVTNTVHNAQNIIAWAAIWFSIFHSAFVSVFLQVMESTSAGWVDQNPGRMPVEIIDQLLNVWKTWKLGTWRWVRTGFCRGHKIRFSKIHDELASLAHCQQAPELEIYGKCESLRWVRTGLCWSEHLLSSGRARHVCGELTQWWVGLVYRLYVTHWNSDYWGRCGSLISVTYRKYE